MSNKVENKFEIKCREIAIKKLVTPINQLTKLVASEKEKREEAFKALSVYQTYEEIQDVFAYGEMTEEERYLAIELLENHDVEMTNIVTNNSAALSILQDMVARLNREIKEFKWSSLSDEEKATIELENTKHREYIRALARGEVQP